MNQELKNKISESLKQYHQNKKQQSIKDKVISELFHDQRLKDTINYSCQKHDIPTNAEIQNDILMVVMEELVKYPLDKFINAYQDDPIRILKLAKTLVLRKGVYPDYRSKKYWMHTIGQQIKHQSTLSTLFHIDTVSDESEDYNVPQVSPEETISDIPMWDHVKTKLTTRENRMLNQILKPVPTKYKGQKKKDYRKLLPKLKIIIMEYKQLN